MNTSGPLFRCLAVWLAVSAASSGLLLWLVGELSCVRWHVVDFDALLGFTAEAALGLCAIWFWAVTTVVTAQAAQSGAAAGSGLDPLLCPPPLRRLLLAACGIALTTSLVSAPALAAHGSLGSGQHHAEGRQVSPANALIGLSLPDRATAAESRRVVHHSPPTMIRVRADDTLWSLAKGLLPAGASDAEIEVGWRAIHCHNRAVIGTDPDLILPGTELSIPDLEEVVR